MVVLLGGGVESTAIVASLLKQGDHVLPVHVHTGLIWDDCEADWARRFCVRSAQPGLLPLVEIAVSLQDFLREHWAVTGHNVPQAGDDSARLEIPLRNLSLMGFAVHRVKPICDPIDLVLGTTADNHYPDGSREYFDHCERLLSLEAGGRAVRIHTPFVGQTKVQIIREADPAALAGSFSCVNPDHGQHCGRCIKCGRRQEAFRLAGVSDPTHYAVDGAA